MIRLILAIAVVSFSFQSHGRLLWKHQPYFDKKEKQRSAMKKTHKKPRHSFDLDDLVTFHSMTPSQRNFYLKSMNVDGKKLNKITKQRAMVAKNKNNEPKVKTSKTSIPKQKVANKKTKSLEIPEGVLKGKDSKLTQIFDNMVIRIAKKMAKERKTDRMPNSI